jgi:hypothetical protein
MLLEEWSHKSRLEISTSKCILWLLKVLLYLAEDSLTSNKDSNRCLLSIIFDFYNCQT